MADKQQPQGHSARRATEDDDVEGHRVSTPRAAEPDGHSKSRAVEPEGHLARKATEDDDVEGHSMLINPLIARELSRARERDVQANVKRHNFENDARAAKKDRG
jgi:hypothetical protein